MTTPSLAHPSMPLATCIEAQSIQIPEQNPVYMRGAFVVHAEKRRALSSPRGEKIACFRLLQVSKVRRGL